MFKKKKKDSNAGIVLKNRRGISLEGEFLKEERQERILRVCEWQRSLLFPPRGRVSVDRNSEETSACDFKGKDGRFNPLDNRAQHKLSTILETRTHAIVIDIRPNPTRAVSPWIEHTFSRTNAWQHVAPTISSAHHKSFFFSLVCNEMFLDVKIYLFIRYLVKNRWISNF